MSFVLPTSFSIHNFDILKETFQGNYEILTEAVFFLQRLSRLQEHFSREVALIGKALTTNAGKGDGGIFAVLEIMGKNLERESKHHQKFSEFLNVQFVPQLSEVANNGKSTIVTETESMNNLLVAYRKSTDLELKAKAETFSKTMKVLPSDIHSNKMEECWKKYFKAWDKSSDEYDNLFIETGKTVYRIELAERDRMYELKQLAGTLVEKHSSLVSAYVIGRKALREAASHIFIKADHRTLAIKNVEKSEQMHRPFPRRRLMDIFSEIKTNRCSEDLSAREFDFFLQKLEEAKQVGQKFEEDFYARRLQNSHLTTSNDIEVYLRSLILEQRSMLYETSLKKLIAAKARREGHLPPAMDDRYNILTFTEKMQDYTVLNTMLEMAMKGPETLAPSVDSVSLQMAPEQESSTPTCRGKQLVSKYRVTVNYKPLRSDELVLRPGDTVRVVRKFKDGWWEGICKGKTGKFPSTHVSEISQKFDARFSLNSELSDVTTA